MIGMSIPAPTLYRENQIISFSKKNGDQARSGIDLGFRSISAPGGFSG
jgi:hypothetical protein